MTLRRKLLFRYAGVAFACSLLLAGWLHHELVIEPRMMALRQVPGAIEPWWSRHAETFFFIMMPIVLGSGWWLMRRTLAPIDQLACRVANVDAQNLDQAIARPGGGDEIDRLTDAFNDLMARLDRTFRHAREFALYASHELKTPLTVLRADFEAVQREPSSPPACYECASGRLEEIQRLAWIVDSLTLLTKADVGLAPIEKKLVFLTDLVCECFDDAQVLGEPHGVSTSMEFCDTVVVMGDRQRLRQLLLNLADNAVKHNCPDGKVTLSLRDDGDWATIVISNTGPGIPIEWQNRVFERFVRGPNAQGASDGGCGLGLSICQWIVQAHGGTIDLTSAPDGLTVATVRLPTHV